MTTVVNIKDGFPSGGVYIGRAGKGMDGYFGNPWRLGRREHERERVLATYRSYSEHRFDTDSEFRDRVRALRGKVLVCFCAPKSCHGDVLAELAER